MYTYGPSLVSSGRSSCSVVVKHLGEQQEGQRFWILLRVLGLLEPLVSLTEKIVFLMTPTKYRLISLSDVSWYIPEGLSAPCPWQNIILSWQLLLFSLVGQCPRVKVRHQGLLEHSFALYSHFAFRFVAWQNKRNYTFLYC